MVNMTAELVGSDLRAARKAAGYTQASLGALIGVTGSAVGQWETGATKPLWTQAQKLRELLTPEPLTQPSAGTAAPDMVAALRALEARVGEMEQTITTAAASVTGPLLALPGLMDRLDARLAQLQLEPAQQQRPTRKARPS